MPRYFTYKFRDGPLSSAEELSGNWSTGNCRRAVQHYIFTRKNLFLSPNDILCPAGYYKTGTFVVDRNQVFHSDLLTDGDVIYAEKIRDKNGKDTRMTEKAFTSVDEYIISLHTALFTGKRKEEIWHATAVEGNSCYWSFEKFLNYYHPVAAKRI